MSIVNQVEKMLVDPDKHGAILRALADILEKQGERGVKQRIEKWVEEIQAETPPFVESEE
jgi:gamma-glutamyl phosphate reductase